MLSVNIKDERLTECIRGVVYDMGAPSLVHEEIVSELHARIWGHIKKNKGTCRVYSSNCAVYLENSKDYVLPDVTVVCDKSKRTSKGCAGAPDMVVEVVSPTSTLRDYYLKNNLYMESGVREYWIVNPVNETVSVMFNGDTITYKEYDFESKVPVGIFEGLIIDFKEIKEVIEEG